MRAHSHSPALRVRTGQGPTVERLHVGPDVFPSFHEV